MASVAIKVGLDYSGLNRGMLLAQTYSRRTPAMAVNTAGFFVARAWVREMPRVSVATIDTELSVSVQPGRTKKGRISKSKRNQMLVAAPGGKSYVDGVSFAALIIQARARPGSRYNVLTGGRYALAKSPFAGVTRAEGAAAMRDLISRMLKGRRSSIAWLASSIKPIIRDLEKVVARKYRRGAPGSDNLARSGDSAPGEAIPAAPGQLYAVCILSSLVGTQGQNAVSMNKALWLYGLPAAQRALDYEAARNMQFVFEQELKDMRGQFSACGIVVEG